ncbi:hypothetical protein [Nocardia sp. NPDC050717]|uniref:hypothetical protein n=1 Tax=Nocardia sp. NPDC050717 TaxID=3157221 RepID=UPI0033FD488C
MKTAIAATLIAAIGLLGAGVAAAEPAARTAVAVAGSLGGGGESGRAACGTDRPCESSGPTQSGRDQVGNSSGRGSAPRR